MVARAEEMREVYWTLDIVCGGGGCVVSAVGMCPLPVHLGHRYCVGVLPRQMIAHRLTQ